MAVKAEDKPAEETKKEGDKAADGAEKAGDKKKFVLKVIVVVVVVEVHHHSLVERLLSLWSHGRCNVTARW